MKLTNACLCGNCDELFDRNTSRVCPACTSPHFLPLVKFLQPLENEPEVGGREEQRDATIQDAIKIAQEAAPKTPIEQLNAVAEKLMTKKEKGK